MSDGDERAPEETSFLMEQQSGSLEEEDATTAEPLPEGWFCAEVFVYITIEMG